MFRNRFVVLLFYSISNKSDRSAVIANEAFRTKSAFFYLFAGPVFRDKKDVMTVKWVGALMCTSFVHLSDRCHPSGPAIGYVLGNDEFCIFSSPNGARSRLWGALESWA